MLGTEPPHWTISSSQSLLMVMVMIFKNALERSGFGEFLEVITGITVQTLIMSEVTSLIGVTLPTRLIEVGGRAQKKSFFQMVAKSFLSVQSYSN